MSVWPRSRCSIRTSPPSSSKRRSRSSDCAAPLIGGSVNGEELADPKFHPFWAKAEQLGVLIFIHPQGTRRAQASGRLKGNGVLDNVIGNPLETTIALSHLIFEGTLDRFPA